MRNVFFAFALGLLTISATYAQTDNQVNTQQNPLGQQQASPEERAARQTKMMAKSLDLTSDQEAQVQTLNLKRLNEMNAFREKYNGNTASQPNASLDEAKTLRRNYETQLKAILTPEQYTKYEAQRGNMRDRRSGNMRRNNE